MIKTFRIIMPMLFALYTSTLSTIINIPGDYPTIQQGIDASTDGDTVLVQPGIYYENINFNGNNIVLGSLFLMTGDDSYIATTIIDGNSSGSVVTFSQNEDSTAILTGFTIIHGSSMEGGGVSCIYSDPVITNNIITLNFANNYGAGIYCYHANPVILYNDINSNTIVEQFARGGGIYCGVSAPLIKNNIIYNNSSMGMGGGMSCAAGEPILINNAFYGNVAGWGGCGLYCWQASPIIKNCIFWDDLPSEIMVVNSSFPDISYSDIEGYWPGTGNIDIFPQFRDPGNSDFHLMSTFCGDAYDSPCIDVGDPTIQDYLLDCDWGLGDQTSDMGAYGGGDSTLLDIDDSMLQWPKETRLLQNYPNPFNTGTNIEFALSEHSYVSVIIYNILGQEVETLYEGLKQPGSHTLNWEAGDYPSGVYFARLETGSYSRNIKMLLLK